MLLFVVACSGISAMALGLRILKVGYSEAQSLAVEFRHYEYLQKLLTSYHVWILSRAVGVLALGIAMILLPFATKDDWRWVEPLWPVAGATFGLSALAS
jgi:hypothetical protein